MVRGDASAAADGLSILHRHDNVVHDYLMPRLQALCIASGGVRLHPSPRPAVRLRGTGCPDPGSLLSALLPTAPCDQISLSRNSMFRTQPGADEARIKVAPGNIWLR